MSVVASTTHKGAKRYAKLLIALALAVVAARSVVASEEGDVMAPVRQFIDGFNKSDIKMAQAACADQTFIIDDFAPHEWRGSGATSKCFRDLTRMGKKNGMSEAFVTLLKPRQVNVTGTHAYVIVPVNSRYNDKGQLVKRTGDPGTAQRCRRLANCRMGLDMGLKPNVAGSSELEARSLGWCRCS